MFNIFTGKGYKKGDVTRMDFSVKNSYAFQAKDINGHKIAKRATTQGPYRETVIIWYEAIQDEPVPKYSSPYPKRVRPNPIEWMKRYAI